ncbi:MAG: 50S ribosomal protein L21 [Patescibacteria group bacterium]|nr:50S ribosomal protein L21 [Patescibacteria group bacterium]
MAKIAVIATGGKQYKVKEGETIKVEKLELAAGEKVKFDTLLVAETDGSQFEVGSPSLGEKVSAEVVDTAKQDKVQVVKYKSKTRYKKNVGHRQLKTAVKILSIA